MPGNPLTDENWASDVTDTIERVIGMARKPVEKVIVVVRALVFGIVAALAAVALLLLLIVVGVRLLQTFLDSPCQLDHDSSVWVSYMVMAGILGVAGVFSMRLRRPKEA
jgi:hypothetical protein